MVWGVSTNTYIQDNTTYYFTMIVARCKHPYSVRWHVVGGACIGCSYFWWCEFCILICVNDFPFRRHLCQLYFWTYSLASERWRNLLCWVVGCASRLDVCIMCVKLVSRCQYNWFNCSARFHWLGSRSTNHGCGYHWYERQLRSDESTAIASHNPLVPRSFGWPTSFSGVYAAIIISHAVVCCLGTRILARLQTVYIVLNVLYDLLLKNCPIFLITNFLESV